MVPSFTRPFYPWLLFLGYVERESLLNEDDRFKPHERMHCQSVCWNRRRCKPIQSSSPAFCKAYQIMHWKWWKSYWKYHLSTLELNKIVLFYMYVLIPYVPRLCGHPVLLSVLYFYKYTIVFWALFRKYLPTYVYKKWTVFLARAACSWAKYLLGCKYFQNTIEFLFLNNCF